MAKKPKTTKAPKTTVGERIHHLEQVVHDHVLAAEVAAEESAGYGSVTSAIEAAEAAVDPEHELGHNSADHERERGKHKDTEAADG